MQNRRTLFAAISGLLLSMSLAAQQQSPTAPAGSPAGASGPGSLSSSLGVYVFPAKNQTSQQQSSDEGTCFGWAKSQTGIDPMAIKPQPASQASTSTASAGAGAPARGAVGGTATGAAVGAIAGDAGKGAAIGATTGIVAGVAQKRRAQQQAAAQQQQAASQAAQASVADQKASYNKAFSACMEGKGYTVK